MAKRFKVNKAVKVNTKCSKNGIKWEYSGKVENWEKVVDDFVNWRNSERWTSMVAIRITDTETGEVVCEKWVE